MPMLYLKEKPRFKNIGYPALKMGHEPTRPRQSLDFKTTMLSSKYYNERHKSLL